MDTPSLPSLSHTITRARIFSIRPRGLIEWVDIVLYGAGLRGSEVCVKPRGQSNSGRALSAVLKRIRMTHGEISENQ